MSSSIKQFFTSRAIYRATIGLLGLTLCLHIGCGNAGYSLVPVAGTVSSDGRPLANAQVTFSPAGGQKGPASVATTDAQGHYSLVTLDNDTSGAVAGLHRVSITTARASGADERATISRERVPPKYRNGSFQLEVPEEGTDTANVEVLTKPAMRK